MSTIKRLCCHEQKIKQPYIVDILFAKRTAYFYIVDLQIFSALEKDLEHIGASDTHCPKNTNLPLLIGDGH